MARDPLELRKHVPTVPDDLNDPPRFGQLIETTKDAFVLELRRFFSGPDAQALPGRLAELSTIAKYDTGFGAGLDPYETYVKIVEDFPDIVGKLPHVAVTAASGGNKRMTFGRPFVAHTQAPPRVVTANPGPYALAAAAAQVSTVTVLTPPVGPTTFQLILNEVTFEFQAVGGETAGDVLAGLRTLLRAQVDLFIDVQVSPGLVPVMTLRARGIGVPFTLEVGPGLSAVTVTPAGAAQPDMLVYQTQPIGSSGPIRSLCIFEPKRFPNANPVTAALPADVARVFNEQGLYGYARVVPVGLGEGVQFECGGPYGGVTPNMFEVLPETSDGLLAAFGLGDRGASAPGDTITGIGPDMTLNVAGAPFLPAMVGRYVSLAGTGLHDGRFLVTSAATGALGFSDPDGVAGALTVGSTWFVGFRDDSRNPLRPVQNRYHQAAQLTVTIDLWAESPNERRELTDLVLSYFTFFMELKHFTIYGRGIFDEAYPQEHYQISIHQEVTGGEEQDFPRGEDNKNRVYVARVTVPVTTNHFLDRQVTVAYGPQAGQTWQLRPGDVTEDPTLPPPS